MDAFCANKTESAVNSLSSVFDSVNIDICFQTIYFIVL